MATEPDFTIADVLAFARSKPADERYCFVDSNTCALAQFGMATGRSHLAGPAGSSLLKDWPDLKEAVNPGAKMLYISIAHTFGGLVTRLEALCPETPVTASNWLSIDAYLVERVEA